MKEEVLLGTVLGIVFFAGMIWLSFKTGLFQGFIKEVKGWKQDYLEWKLKREKKRRARK
ncbi:hypothetical protein J7K42_02700 [bacterium]|nr:hypothetical protein [bacterium]